MDMGDVPDAIETLKKHKDKLLRGETYPLHITDAIDTLLAALAQFDPTPCVWTVDEDGVWHSGCGEDWQFTYDAPTENGYVFCHKCGRKIEVKESEVDADD